LYITEPGLNGYLVCNGTFLSSTECHQDAIAYFSQLVSDVSDRLHRVEFMDEKRMMKLKRRFSGLISELSWNFHGGTEKSHREPQSM
jgi:hypothetical protein